jgi:sarcosine oxidase, subunit gamma
VTADLHHADPPEALSRTPLADRAEVLAGGSVPGRVTLRALPRPAQVSLRLRDDAARARCEEAIGVGIPTAAGSAATGGDGARSVLWLGPDEWLVVGPPGEAGALIGALQEATAGVHASVVDVSSNRTVLELSGPAARDVLDGGCRIDLHPRSFGPGSCVATHVAQAAVYLHQTGDDTYLLYVRSSFARYLSDWLLDGMLEHHS